MNVPKFRVWLPAIKEFRYTELGKSYPFISTDVICQYTGFKDINNTEIYEGDIIKLISAIGTARGTRIVKLEEYEDSEGYICFGYQWYSYIEYGIEIIGNIYQNPEM